MPHVLEPAPAYFVTLPPTVSPRSHAHMSEQPKPCEICKVVPAMQSVIPMTNTSGGWSLRPLLADDDKLCSDCWVCKHAANNPGVPDEVLLTQSLELRLKRWANS